MRWTQTDPVIGSAGNPMSLNPYTYVGCDPINGTDPSGRSTLECVAAWAGLGVSAVAAGLLGTFGAFLVGTATAFTAVALVSGLIASALISTLLAEIILEER